MLMKLTPKTRRRCVLPGLLFILFTLLSSLSLAVSQGAVGTLLEERLPNGLKVVVLENPASPTVSVNIFISAGSLDETEQTTGLAHFYEHMFFRGTPTLSGLQFKKSIEDLGGVTNATTSKDMTHYFIALPAEHAERGLELLADALIRAELDPKGIEVEREVVLEEYRIGENNPGRIATEALYRMAYKDHPYGLSTIGTKERIRSYQRGDFVRWRNQHYQPRRSTVVVVGDVEAQKVMRRAKVLFAEYRGEDGGKRILQPPPPAPETPIYEEGSGPIGGSLILLGFPSPSAHDQPDVYAVDVMTFLMGQGKRSLLYQSLVKEQKIAESVGATYLTPRQQGLIIFSGFGESKNAKEIKDGLLVGIERVRQGDFSDEDLERARALLLQTHLQGTESNAGKADTIGYYHALEVPEFWKTYADEVRKVKREDVLRVANTYLGGGHWGYTMKPQRGGRR